MENTPAACSATSATCCSKSQSGKLRHLPAWATRNRLMMVGGAVVLGGIAFNWGWLTAIGAAPILLAMAPCGIMCALGICAMGMKKSTSADTPKNPLGE